MATGQLLPSLQPLPVPWKPTNTIHSTVNIRVCMACALGSRLGVLGVLFHLLSYQSEEADSIIQDPSVGPGSAPSFLIPIPPLPSRTSESSKNVPNIADAHQRLQSCNHSSAQPGHSREKYPQGHAAPRDLAYCGPSPLLLRNEHQHPTPMTEFWGQSQIPIPTWCSVDLYYFPPQLIWADGWPVLSGLQHHYRYNCP